MPYLLTLHYPNFEIIVVLDKKEESPWDGVMVLASGKVGPAQKRDIAAKRARGDFLAFIDDDAYPRADWLKMAKKHFRKKDVAVVCGPGVNPPFRGFLERAAGLISESKLCWGNAILRNKPEGKVRDVDDFITANLLVRKSDYEKIGGFSSAYWPGEDTSLCLNITEKLHKRIIYDPEVVVYHHRRLPGIPYLKQVGAYGLHRGFFAKKFPQTSLRLPYFVPSFFVLGVISSMLIAGVKLFVPQLMPDLLGLAIRCYFGIFLVYLFLLLFEFQRAWFKSRSFWLALLVVPGICSVHIVYGVQFIRGLLKKDLVSKLRE